MRISGNIGLIKGVLPCVSTGSEEEELGGVYILQKKMLALGFDFELNLAD